LFAVALLAAHSPDLAQRLDAFRVRQSDVARSMTLPL